MYIQEDFIAIQMTVSFRPGKDRSGVISIAMCTSSPKDTYHQVEGGGGGGRGREAEAKGTGSDIKVLIARTQWAMTENNNT